MGRRGAFRPEAFADGQYRYVFWLHASPEGAMRLWGSTTSSQSPLLWRQMGIDEEAPWYHVGFLFLSTLMLSMVYTAANLG